MRLVQGAVSSRMVHLSGVEPPFTSHEKGEVLSDARVIVPQQNVFGFLRGDTRDGFGRIALASGAADNLVTARNGPTIRPQRGLFSRGQNRRERVATARPYPVDVVPQPIAEGVEAQRGGTFLLSDPPWMRLCEAPT